MKYIIVIALVVLLTYHKAFTGGEDTSEFTTTFLSLINDHREAMGLKKLIHDEEMDAIVGFHSEQMAEGKIPFGHLGFSERCEGSRKVLGGGNWCGENVAMGQKTPLQAYTSWMNSPGHRENIENDRATHTGFAYAKDENGQIYWTQIFMEKI
jgi:uncharacterized protein YkwD